MSRDRKHGKAQVPRRGFLRGVGGVALGLPFLEYFAPSRASAAAPAKRWVFAFAGCSTGMDGGDSVTPATEGLLASRLTRGLMPLDTEGVADVTSVVTGLKIPWAAAGSVPAGGRIIEFHGSTPTVLCSGMRSDGRNMHAPTTEWIAADVLGQGTRFAALNYRVQAAFYRGNNDAGGARGRISARMVDGNLQQVDPIVSPRVAYETLFTGFTPPDPGDAAKVKALLARRKSVVDLVSNDTERLLARLGKADHQRMERHFDELRALESRLEGIEPPTDAACKQFAAPGNDPPIGAPVENGEQGDGAGYDSNNAYSNEEKRAEVMIDLVHMAFVCGLSRSASLMLTYDQCFLNMNPLFGYPSDLHEISHFSMGGSKPGQDALADGVGWHVKHWAHLAKKLRETEDSDGSNILEHTAMVLAFEGGVGFDPEQGGQGSPHSSENMIVLVGGLAGGLNQSGGKHIKATGTHPVAVINTALNAVGVTAPLGEVTGTVASLVG